MRSLLRGPLILLAVLFTACNNYDLLDSLERPGSKESFSDRLFIFVTLQMTAGDMFALNAGGCSGTGVGKADCVCQALAAQNSLRKSATSKFLAWLSAPGSPMNCRLGGAMGLGCAPLGSQTWYNTNREVVFTGIESATTGLLGSTPTLSASPKYTESGFVAPSMSDNVWTGTDAGGLIAASNNTCGAWDQNTPGFQGRTGQSDTMGPAWTNSSDFGCDLFKRIYCIAVP